MPYKAQHADSPCHPDLPEQEQVPAKMWELLRRNEFFKKAVGRLAQLDDRAKNASTRIIALKDRANELGQNTPEARELEAECRRRSETKFRAKGMLQNVGKTHPFAAAALQWLVPEPWFEVRHEIIAPDVDLTKTKFPPVRVVRLESGSTPDPNDKPNWREFEAQGEFDAFSVRSNAGCAPMVRGPQLVFSVAQDPRLRGGSINPIQEWKDYHALHKGPFTLNDPWRCAPPKFKRELCWLWRQRDSRQANPLTDARDDVPVEHEATFFQGWRLMDAIVAGSKRGTLIGEDHVRALRFDDYATKYRVFAFPNSIRTRSEARRMSAWLLEQLAANLPDREKEILGTPLQWDILLAYEDRRQKGDEHLTALRYTFDSLFLKLPSVRGPAAAPMERTLDAVLQHRVAKKMLVEAESTRWHSWVDDFSRLNSPIADSGLIQQVFPRLETALFLPEKRQKERLKR